MEHLWTVFTPYDLPQEELFHRTTHLCICAHPDDAEIMAFHGIKECFFSDDMWFTVVVLTNGIGRQTTDQSIKNIRKNEQIEAAKLGRYNAVIFFDYSSSEFLNHKDTIQKELISILHQTTPTYVYTHNPFDNHRTHQEVVSIVYDCILETNIAIPHTLGCAVWTSLDWVNNPYKVLLDVSDHSGLQESLISCHQSQLQQKRYDKAVIARQYANAVFQDAIATLRATRIDYCLDLHIGIQQRLSLIDYKNKIIQDL